MNTAQVLVTGYVQGIGYRYFVKRNALNLGVFGWVKNLPNGQVECLFQADSKETIEKLINECKKGPFLAKISDLKVDWLNIKKRYGSFEVLT